MIEENPNPRFAKLEELFTELVNEAEEILRGKRGTGRRRLIGKRSLTTRRAMP